MNLVFKKIYQIILPLFLIFLSCDNQYLSIDNEDSIQIQLIEEYIKKANDKESSLVDRKKITQKALHFINELEDSEIKRKKLEDVSSIYFRFKDNKKYKELILQRLKLSNNIKDSIGLAKAWSSLGYYYQIKLNQNDSAYYFFSKSVKIFDKIQESPVNHGTNLLNMARMQRTFKDYTGSESSLTKAIPYFIKTDKKQYLRMCYNTLGIIANDSERYDEALNYYEKYKEYIDVGEDGKYQTAISYNNIGNVFKEQKKYEKAIANYDKALLYNNLLKKEPKLFARILDNKAYAKFLLKKNENIEEELLYPLKIRKKENDVDGIIESSLHLAEYYASKNDTINGYEYGIIAKENAEKLNKNDYLLKSLLLLSEISSREKGLEYTQKYIAINNELQKQERTNREKFARIRFETDQIEGENIKISKTNEILGISILIISALFLLIYIIVKQQQSNKELEFTKTQQDSNEEIYRLMLSQQIKLEEGRQLEQKRMSEELHDGVLGRLFGVRLSLDGLNQQQQGDGFTEIRTKYITELKAIEKEIRLISHDLGTDTLITDVAFVDVVRDLVSTQCNIHKLEYNFRSDIDIDWDEIPDNKKVNLFRIVQESLQNIFKHANADSVKVNFVQEEEIIKLTINDDGVGFKSNKVKKGIGIKNITSRVEQMNGEVEFLSDIETGTQVSISMPV